MQNKNQPCSAKGVNIVYVNKWVHLGTTHVKNVKWILNVRKKYLRYNLKRPRPKNSYSLFLPLLM